MTTQAISSSRPEWVRMAIYADALVTDLTGLALVIGSGTLATHLGMSSGIVMELGIGLFVYALALFVVASRWLTPRNAYLLGGLNVVWIVGTELLMLSNALPMTPEGRGLIMASNVIVAVLAALEIIGARQMSRG
ncbi:MAG: hypothetical protein KF716_27670 [Anaerolineae bacterium]|nr:hypothetical protein [Anaerolineae bacterium]